MKFERREPRIRNLGAVFGAIIKAAEKVAQSHSDIAEDLRAFHAPSECGDIAYRNADRPMIEALAEVRRTTGLSWEEVVEELRARTGGRYVGWTFYSNMIPSTEFDS